ncbi:hypothetical protein [Leptolyngbya sp. NIES-2104]|uniref:hypothetical protein n=1 Tax=Leptolyngbya sp. NIES-2104 TaxID=1552121 RepID=UPI0006EC5755|nr:hypothetical protein [Leptolyngbya sp. NIES-2104]GAP94768.1 hypothetical protein NIES2104_12850 [Leptolyngbya sp. NIES-2104]
MSEINTEAQTHDAELVAEEIAAGDRPAPKVDVSADYEAAQEFSQSNVDKAGKGQEAAEAATAPHFEAHSAEETELPTDHLASEPTGDPDLYRDMAKEVSHGSSATGNVDDDLVKKALELGKPGEH